MTENEKLALWFSELRIEELREGGVIMFDMQDGTITLFGVVNPTRLPFFGEVTLYGGVIRKYMSYGHQK